MLRAGVRCALGTDDPGLIPCDLAVERGKAAAMGLTEAELLAMDRFGQEDAWCLPSGRQKPVADKAPLPG
jgi:adenosine deaminase